MTERILSNIYAAMAAVGTNKIRSLLTTLGIIFGVAAVISMLAIGNGAQVSILNEIKLVGVNNIVIEPELKQTQKDDVSNLTERKKFSPGLSMADFVAINEIVPGLKQTSPEISIETNVIRNSKIDTVRLIGVGSSYFEIYNFKLEDGQMFTQSQGKDRSPVCIIGQSIKNEFFPIESAIGKNIKVGTHWLTIIGVLQRGAIAKSSVGKLGIHDFNKEIYCSIQMLLIRYENRGLITEPAMRQSAAINKGIALNNVQTKKENINKNYNQLDRIIIKVEDSDKLNPISNIVSRILIRRHNQVHDFAIEIPELLLKQQQHTNDIFNYVLGAIAAISLLVGGIGIMNIMLASVLERIKEIGLRLALGARKSDILIQFLAEATIIGISGSVIGVFLGIVMSSVVSEFAQIPTTISISSILLSFGVAATVGLIFGMIPARKASQQNPITSLHHE